MLDEVVPEVTAAFWKLNSLLSAVTPEPGVKPEKT